MSTMGAFPKTIAPRTVFLPRFPPEELSTASSRLLRWLDRQHQRAQLAKLEDWQLDDIGVSRIDAAMESRRWD